MKKIPVRQIHTFQKEPDFYKSFSIRDVQAMLGGKEMIQELHRHDYFYVLALKTGAGSHEIDFIDRKVCDNSVYFMRPGQVHRLVLKAKSTGYLMAFRNEFYFPDDNTANQLLRKVSGIDHYRLNANEFQKLFTVLAFIFQEYASKQERYLEAIRAGMRIFFIELGRRITDSPAKNLSPYKQEGLERFLELLEVHVLNNKLVAEYAALLNLSTYQLNAITKETLGKTPSELINERIILEAKRYLLATTNQINQIADQLGYEDVSYFIRFFKKYTGHSPEAFRNNFR